MVEFMEDYGNKGVSYLRYFLTNCKTLCPSQFHRNQMLDLKVIVPFAPVGRPRCFNENKRYIFLPAIDCCRCAHVPPPPRRGNRFQQTYFACYPLLKLLAAVTPIKKGNGLVE